jgi:hypothetical protein
MINLKISKKGPRNEKIIYKSIEDFMDNLCRKEKQEIRNEKIDKILGIC